MWMDGQGPPPHSDNLRPPYDDRPGGPRRGSGIGGANARFRGDRSRDRQSRWNKDDVKESRGETSKKPSPEKEIKSENEEIVRDTETPCHDEKPIEETPSLEPGKDVVCPQPKEPLVETAIEQTTQSAIQYERDTATPCHDEPEVPNIVVENPDMANKEA